MTEPRPASCRWKKRFCKMFAGLFALFRDSVVARLSHEGCGIARREPLRRSSCKSSTLGAEKFGAFINFLLARRRASLLFDARKLGRAADFVGPLPSSEPPYQASSVILHVKRYCKYAACVFSRNRYPHKGCGNRSMELWLSRPPIRRQSQK